ncbi:hypothetical protein DEMA109039_18315 [Deinococcus marmoris]
MLKFFQQWEQIFFLILTQSHSMNCLHPNVFCLRELKLKKGPDQAHDLYDAHAVAVSDLSNIQWCRSYLDKAVIFPFGIRGHSLSIEAKTIYFYPDRTRLFSLA